MLTVTHRCNPILGGRAYYSCNRCNLKYLRVVIIVAMFRLTAAAVPILYLSALRGKNTGAKMFSQILPSKYISFDLAL